ncbi:RHS repeat-associated core domain-containing protein [Luteibacter yeojuensis]
MILNKLLRGCVAIIAAAAPVMSSAGVITYYYTDPQGSVLATADGAGNLLSQSDYRPYGVPAMGVGIDGVGYTGHVQDADIDLIYMQARYYDAYTGRFLSTDSSVPAAGAVFKFSRMAYADLSPLNHIDPDGRDSCPGQSKLRCVRSDNGKAQDLRSTTGMDKVVLAGKEMVRTTARPEKVATVTGSGDDAVMQPATGEVVRTTKTDGVILDVSKLPPGTTAVAHGHVEGNTPGLSSKGIISPGDAQPLGQGFINYVVNGDRVGKYEIVDGRIQVSLLEGAMSRDEYRGLEKSINAQQAALDAQRP